MNPPPLSKKEISQPDAARRPSRLALLPAEKKPLRLGPGMQIRPIEPGETDLALAMYLVDDAADSQPVDSKTALFRELARKERYDLSKQMVALDDNQLRHACLFMPQPGGAAFVFLSRPAQTAAQDANQWELAVQTLRQLCRWAFHEGSNLLQVIIEPTDTVRRDLCRAGGFEPLTDLIYMLRPDDDLPHRPTADGLSWLCYDPQHHDLFKQVIKQTYLDSRDCPELENLRDIEDVIRSHKAGGEFDKRFWKLLLRRDKPVGVLLLIPLPMPQTMELTYMGLSPESRGQGLGAFMLREAIACARRRQNRILTLAVDCRNQAALHLYRRFGFKTIFNRTVMIRSLPR